MLQWKETDRQTEVQVRAIQSIQDDCQPVYNATFIRFRSSPPPNHDLLGFYLVSSRSLFLFLLEPALFNGRGLASRSLAFHLHLLALVRLQLVGQVGLLGRRRRRGHGELLDVGLGIAGLGRRGLVGTQFTQVQVLHRVGYSCRQSANRVGDNTPYTTT